METRPLAQRHRQRRLLTLLAPLAWVLCASLPAAASGSANLQQPAPPAPAAPARDKVTLALDINFDSLSAVPGAEAAARLSALAERAKTLALELVIAVGHADGSEADAQRLSVQRAEAAKQRLVAEGVPAARIYTEGRGAQNPVADNQTPQGRAQNRRVELEMVGTRERR